MLMEETGVHVIDVENSKVMENMTVKIKGGSVVSVSPTKLVDLQEEGWASVNAAGLYMCPGLIDCACALISPDPP